MMRADAETGYQFEASVTITTEFGALLLRQQPRAVRLSDDHYLVHWEPQAPLWCVVDMGALDEHAASCPSFRDRQCCEHLDLISELCARECGWETSRDRCAVGGAS